MPQSLAHMVTHLVFSTKNRRPLIQPEVQAELAAYIGGILNQWKSPPIEIACLSDHAHVLFCLSKNFALAKVIEETKKGSSKWLKSKSPDLRDFYWQAGYGAFSVSQSNVESVRAYILRQDEHHRKTTFQEEFRAFLVRHHVDFDEQYVWD
jgi:putative transposase